MGLRFRKSMKAGPFRVNLSNSGISYSVGTKGARVTKTAKGKTRTTLGIPGTGVSYSKTVGGKKKVSANKKKSNPSSAKSKDASKQTTTGYSGEPIKKSWPMAIILTIVAFALVGILAFIVLFVGNAIFSIFNYEAATGNSARNILILVPLGLGALSGLIMFVLLKPEKPVASEAATESETAPAPDPASETKASKPDSEVKTYHVAGVSYYIDALLSMMEPNELYSYKKQDLIDTCHYDESIYKQTVIAKDFELIPEPDNPHDPNAIKAVLNGKLVGYIAAKDCPHLLEMIENDLILNIHCDVSGGKYKRVNEDYDSIKDKSTYTMETGEDEYGITIYIREKVTK